MFDHVKFGVSDYAASKAFFLKALEPLGVAVVSEGPPTYGVELSRKGRASLCLYEAGASSLGVHGRESPASRSFLSRGSGGGWQRQWCTWSAPALPRELLCSFCHWSGRAQHRSGLPRTGGVTLPSRGRPQAGFAHLRPPLISNVRSRMARPSPKKRIASLGESHVWLEICLRYLHPHNTREAVACTNNARDHKAVSVWNERRKRMEGRFHVENVC